MQRATGPWLLRDCLRSALGLEPTTSRPVVEHASHWAIASPKCRYSRGFAGEGRQMRVGSLKMAIFASFVHCRSFNSQCTSCCRLWFVSDIGCGVTSQRPCSEPVPSEIGYMNVIPKCIDCSGKYPHYENLPETYAAINVYLAANPLEGRLVYWFALSPVMMLCNSYNIRFVIKGLHPFDSRALPSDSLVTTRGKSFPHHVPLCRPQAEL